MKFERWIGGLMVVAACGALPDHVSAQTPTRTLPQPPLASLAPNTEGTLGKNPGVRVVNQPAAVHSMPSLKRGEVMMSAVPGTVFEVLDSQEGWYWVVLARDANGTRKAGWIRAQDVEFVSADQETLEMRGLREKVEQLQREIEKLKNAGDANPNPSTNTSTPPPAPAVESRTLVKARAELEARQREYDEAVKAAKASSETPPSPPAQTPPSPPAQKSQPAPVKKQPSPQVQKSQLAPAQRPQPMHGFTAVSDTPRFDLFAGYAPLWDTTGSVTYPLGWVASVGKPLNNRIAIVGEAGGSYKSVNALGVNVARVQLHTFAAGPQYSRRTGSVTAFGQLLGGLAVGTGSVLGHSLSSTTGFALLPGFGADIPVAGNLGVRVGGELGFVHTSFGWSDDFRFMTGLVLAGGAR